MLLMGLIWGFPMSTPNPPTVVETIDKAITDYELSIDAMRWSPDGFPEPEPVVLPRVEVRFEIRAAAFAEATARLQAAFRALGQAVGEALKQLDPTVREADTARRARLRRMHSSYPAKWGKRR